MIIIIIYALIRQNEIQRNISEMKRYLSLKFYFHLFQVPYEKK